jgi:hypothetical protein
MRISGTINAMKVGEIDLFDGGDSVSSVSFDFGKAPRKEPPNELKKPPIKPPGERRPPVKEPPDSDDPPSEKNGLRLGTHLGRSAKSEPFGPLRSELVGSDSRTAFLAGV